MRQAITGFLFGGTGALIALSAIGKARDKRITATKLYHFDSDEDILLRKKK